VPRSNAELGTRNAGNGNNRNGNRDGREVVLQDLTLVQVAAVLALADGYLGNDSGITQVAAAVRGAGGRATPTVALFGPTDPQVWAPRGPHVKVIRSPDGSMNAITVDAVGAAGGGWAR
jgi:ADP-heptose:LPS heptosyltransferase